MTEDMAWLLWLVVGLPLLGALGLAFVGGRFSERAGMVFGAGAAGATFVVGVVATAVFDREDSGRLQLQTDVAWIEAIDVRFHLGVDGISLPLVLLTCALCLLCLIYLLAYPPQCGGRRNLVALILVMQTGMIGTFLALDLVVFFLFFEVVLIPMWFVIAIWGDEHDEPGRRRAATVFVLFTVLGSAVMLLGFLLVYAEVGTFDMVELADAGGAGIGSGAQVLAALAIGLGLAVKSPMWPFHIWLPDAHAKAPTVGSVLLAGVLLKLGTYGFVRVLVPIVPDGAAALAPALAVLGVVGIVYGSLACLSLARSPGSDIKRLIAYSSVGHMGFVLLGIATLTPAGINGALYANIAHGIITGLLFFLAGAIKDRHGTGDLDNIGPGLYGSTPRLAGLLAFGAVASLGLPGLAGFWGEMLTLLAAYDPAAGLPGGLYLTLMVVGGLGAVLTAAYFLALVRRVCQGHSPRHSAREQQDVTRAEMLVWSPLVAATLVFGLWPHLLLGLTDPAVQALVGVG